MENQPDFTQGTPPGERPSNYLILAIVVTFLCCNIVGVVSIIYAAQVNAKWNGGDYEGAIQDSKNAKLWGMIGLIGGAVLIGIVVIFYGAVIASIMANGGNGYAY